tara:strand:+ start:318 stop:659 length:342 start_codon:yes stop_codon:yes gene_type:complete
MNRAWVTTNEPTEVLIKMRDTIRAIALTSVMAIAAGPTYADDPASTPSEPLTNPIKLQDGSYLFISEDGSMRMVDKSGRPEKMKEDSEMILMDGSSIMMLNKRIWHSHKKMKR